MRPAVFHELTLEAARKLALAERKLLIVEATADWCWGCVEMNRTTWPAPRVVAWIKERAIAIQINVEADSSMAEQLAWRCCQRPSYLSTATSLIA